MFRFTAERFLQNEMNPMPVRKEYAQPDSDSALLPRSTQLMQISIRTKRLFTFTSLPLLMFLASIQQPAIAAEKRPNVLFIVCDDLNTHVSTSGYEHISTPAFEELASSGMKFNRAYCQYPVCGPSRASFLHGLYPESTGVLDNGSSIMTTRPGTVSMPQRFKDAGYWTASTGKIFHNKKNEPGEIAWHANARFENDELPLVTEAREKFEVEHGSTSQGKSRRLWKELYPKIATQTRGQHVGYGPSGLRDDQHKDGKNASQVVSWLEQRSHGDKPFFIALGIQKPHVPFLAPDKYFDVYPKQDLLLASTPANFWDQVPKKAMNGRFAGFGFELGVKNDALSRDYMQAYHACVSFIDAQIGLVLDAVKRLDHWDNTIIVLTSDHGYQLGEHFMWGKVTLFEVCNRVPLIIRAPGRTKANSSSEGLVELVDLFPTLADLCNVTAPAELQGQKLTPMFSNPKHSGKAAVYTVVSRGDQLGKAIRTNRWRYAAWPDGEELYDLERDIAEHHNLVSNARYRSTLEQMRRLLQQTVERANLQRQIAVGK